MTPSRRFSAVALEVTAVPANFKLAPILISPVVVKFLNPVISLLASVTIDFDASTVPGVVTSKYDTSAEVTSDIATFP